MPDSSLEILDRVARLPEQTRVEQKDQLLAQYESQLETTVQKQVLGCMLGVPTDSQLARVWAAALLADAK